MSPDSSPEDWQRWTLEGRDSAGPNPYPTGSDAHWFFQHGRTQYKAGRRAVRVLTNRQARKVAKLREQREQEAADTE